MSVLTFPRLYLRGEMSWDPPVSNNSAAAYDSGSAGAVYGLDEDADAFRARMIRQTVERGDWNYFGTHRCALEATTVVGGTIDPGPTDVAADPIIGAPVQLLGKLVDIDPYGVVSQVFFDELLVGVPGRPHLRARPRRRMVARWITFSRNRSPVDLAVAGGAAAAWQAVFPAQDVEIRRAEGSPLLTRLAAALEDDDTLGLMLRLSTYHTRYFTRDVGPAGVTKAATDAATAALAARQARGEVMSNPAYSTVVGTLGLWKAGDSEATISGRHLIPVGAALAAPAAAEFHPASKVLSLDLSNTVPERDTSLQKVDLGRLTVSVTAAGVTTELGHVDVRDYAVDAYAARGGIVDVAVPDPAAADLIRDGRLAIRTAVSGRPLIAQEQELVAFCDEACVYLEDGETRRVPIVVRERGLPPTRALALVLAAYDTARGEAVVQDPVGVPSTGVVAAQIESSDRVVEHLGLVVVPADQTQALSVPTTLSLGTAQFLTVRTLPADEDLAAVADSELSWDLVLDRILAHYHAVTPRMSTIIDLTDRDAVRTFATRILEVTDPALFETTRYMPVTRDMSANRRALLRRYCERAGGRPPVAPVTPRVGPRSAGPGEAEADASGSGVFPKTTRG